MLYGAQKIIDLYNNDEFQIFIIEGTNGVGKSVLALTLLSEVYHKIVNDKLKPNWNKQLLKKHLGFHPQKVLNDWSKLRKRDYCYVWDDAAFFLHNLDFQNKFVKAIGKSMQVMRTKFGCVIFTCISRNDIISKIKNFESAVIIKVTKDGNIPNSPYPSRRYRRKAKAWHYWESPMNDRGMKYDWEEYFAGHMPDDVYEWYKPLREKYTNAAIKDMTKKMKKDTEIMELKP